MPIQKVRKDKILISPIAEEKTTASGLIISTAGEPSDMRTGTVVLVGEEVATSGLKIGDKVMYQYGTNVIIEGITYVLANDDDVHFILS